MGEKRRERADWNEEEVFLGYQMGCSIGRQVLTRNPGEQLGEEEEGGEEEGPCYIIEMRNWGTGRYHESEGRFTTV